jgi:hypothetical protein
MSERLHYYERRHKAEAMPTKYLSFIMDGMQQTHCLLPWYAHVGQFSEHLPQHIQGKTVLLSYNYFIFVFSYCCCLLLLIDALQACSHMAAF